jgi:hypothetical protein
MAIMAGTATYAQVEIGYAKEGGDTQYDAVKFFSLRREGYDCDVV